MSRYIGINYFIIIFSDICLLLLKTLFVGLLNEILKARLEHYFHFFLIYHNVCMVSTCQDSSGSESPWEPEYKEEGWKDQG